MPLSRRQFLAGATATSALWLAGALACRERTEPGTTSFGPPVDSPVPPRVLQVFTTEQAREVEAIAARIIPTTDTPGATEAGVIWFIDGALNTFASDDGKPRVLAGLAALPAAVAAAHPGQSRFADLTAEQQDAMLTTMEQSEQFGPFFGELRFATVAGMFALPSHGGNADFTGWKLLGLEHVYEYQPPFGWYDHPDNQRALLGRVL